jgi:hypothetical protein
MRTIITFIGAFIRYYYFISTKKPKSLDYVFGDKDNLNNVDQHIPNFIIGLLVISPIILLFAYIVYSFFH